MLCRSFGLNNDAVLSSIFWLKRMKKKNKVSYCWTNPYRYYQWMD